MSWERMFWKLGVILKKQHKNTEKQLESSFCFSPIKPPVWNSPSQGDKEQWQQLGAKKAASNFATIVFED